MFRCDMNVDVSFRCLETNQVQIILLLLDVLLLAVLTDVLIQLLMFLGFNIFLHTWATCTD